MPLVCPLVVGALGSVLFLVLWFALSVPDCHCCGMRRTLSIASGPSPIVGFRAAPQRRYKILLLRPVCGVCAARQLVMIFVASRQKHATRGLELMLYLKPDIDQSEQEYGELLRPQIETLKMADINEDDILKLIQHK